jgi:hypothetical protein
VAVVAGDHNDWKFRPSRLDFGKQLENIALLGGEAILTGYTVVEQHKATIVFVEEIEGGLGVAGHNPLYSLASKCLKNKPDKVWRLAYQQDI